MIIAANNDSGYGSTLSTGDRKFYGEILREA